MLILYLQNHLTNVSISVFDANGRTVFTDNIKKMNSHSYRLNTKAFVSGVYVVDVKSNEVNERDELVVQK